MMECKKGELCIPMWLSPICLSSEHKIANGGNRSTKYSMIKCKILNTTEQKDIVIANLFIKSSEDYASNYNLKTICHNINILKQFVISNMLHAAPRPVCQCSCQTDDLLIVIWIYLYFSKSKWQRNIVQQCASVNVSLSVLICLASSIHMLTLHYSCHQDFLFKYQYHNIQNITIF